MSRTQTYALLILLFYSCAEIDLNCVPTAIACASAWEIEKKKPSRILIYKVTEYLDHAQAEGFDGKNWIPLKLCGIKSVCKDKKFSDKPKEIFNLERITKWIKKKSNLH